MYGNACQPLEVLTKSLLLPTYNNALMEEGAERLGGTPLTTPDTDAALSGDKVR